MFCKNCGSPLPDGATVCPKCTSSGAPATPSRVEAIPTYLLRSILVTILCCMPLGIVSIVYAAKVSGLVAAGRIAEAKAASESARKWSLWALFVGFIVQLLYWGHPFLIGGFLVLTDALPA